MATDLERLTVSLEANVKKFERELARARGVAIKSLGEIEKEAEARGRSISNALSLVGKGIAGALAGLGAGFSLNEVRKAADDYIKIINTLKTAGVAGGELDSVFGKLFDTAQRNAVPLDALAQLYGRVSQAQTTLKATSTELLGLTDIVAQSLRVSGTSATEASGSLLQLAQALSGGKVQAEEYNSLLDGMYPLLQAAAAGLKEAGGDVAKLTSLVKDGKVSSEAFFRAIQAGAPTLEQKLAGSVLTTEQAMTKLNNEFVKAVGEFDKATGASQALAGAITSLAGSIGGVGQAAASAVNGVQSLIGKVNELAQANAGLQRQQALTYQNERAARVAQAREMGLANAGGRDTVAQERADANQAAAEASRKALAGFRQSEAEFRNALRDAPLPPKRPAGAGGGIKPVSLADFKLPGEDKAGGGGSGGADKDRATSLERYVINLQKAGELAKAELATVGLGNVEREKARALVEATAAAQKDHAAGLRETATLTAAEREKILGLAEATAKWKDEAKQVREAMEFASDLAKDAFKGLISDLIAGKNATEALTSAVQKLANKLADKAIDSLFDSLIGKGGGNVFGALFGGGGGGSALSSGTGGLYAKGGYTGRGGKNVPAGVVHRGEYVFSKDAVRRLGVGNLEALHRGYASGGAVGIPSPMSPRIPALGGRSGGGMRVVINNNAAGQVQASAQQQPNGDLSVMIAAVEGQIARNVVRGAGSLAPALGAVRSGRQLRG